MPILTPNTSDMEDFRPSRPGTYRARITEVNAKKSKVKEGGKGNQQMLEVFFRFEAPANEDGISRPVTRRSHLMLEGAGTFGFDQILRCIGETALADQIKANPGGVPFDTDILLNKEVQIVTKHGMYTPQGGSPRMQDEIESFLPA